MKEGEDVASHHPKDQTRQTANRRYFMVGQSSPQIWQIIVNLLFTLCDCVRLNRTAKSRLCSDLSATGMLFEWSREVH